MTGVVERGRLYLTLHCHRQNESCIQMGSDESHFNISLIVRDKVTRQFFTDNNFCRERTAEVDLQPTGLMSYVKVEVAVLGSRP